jgi:hypothetical protein
MGDALQWMNKHFLPSLIANKWKAPEDSYWLKALVKQVTKLCRVGLEARHCAEDFILHRIRPLGHRDKLVFECLRFADPSHNPSGVKGFLVLTLLF